MQGNRLYKFSAVKLVVKLAAVLVLTSCAQMGGTGGYSTPTQPETAPAPLPPATSAAPAITPISTQNKVALLLPLSGRGSDAGQAMSNAAQLAIFDLNASSMELMPRDTGGTPETARAAAQAAIKDGAKLILGPLFAADAKTVSPVALQSGVNVVSFSTDQSVANANTFVLGFLPRSQVGRILSYSAKQGAKNVILVAPSDAYGDAVANAFDSMSRQTGVTNAGILRYTGAQPTENDLRAFVQSPRNFNAVVLAGDAGQSAQISQQLSALGYTPDKVKRLGTGLWDQANLNLPGLDGAAYAASSPHLRKAFEAKYRDTYGAAPPRLASLAYDAAALAVVLSRQKTGYTRQALLNPNGFSGIDGLFRFEADGLNRRGLAVLQVKSGKAQVIEEAPTSF